MPETVLLFGATSAMARHTARVFAAQNAALALVGRAPEPLEALAQDLTLRGASAVHTFPHADINDPPATLRALDAAWTALGTVNYILIAAGSLPDQTETHTSPPALRHALETNFLSPALLCHALADRLTAQGHGTLAVLSSVAGLRGRQSNYSYGAAKGGLTLFLQGLRNRLHPRGIRVLTLLPGFVDTPMTAHVPKGPLFISAPKAGTLIHRALTRRKADIIYIPGFWRLILLIIRAIPEPLFKRLKL